MINHGRTLLLNINGANYQPQYLGEEYIPPVYGALPLPSYLLAARRLLFGAAPERVFLNYRVRELLQTIHATDLAEYIYALDPRVTYWPEQDAVFFNQKKTIVSQKIAGPKESYIFFNGNFSADNATGLSLREYTVRATFEEGQHYVTVEQDGLTANNVKKVVTVDTGLSTPTPVAGTNLSVSIGGAVVPISTLMLETGYDLLSENLTILTLETGGDNTPPPSTIFSNSVFRVSAYAPPAPAVSLVPLLEIMGEPNLIELFGVSNYDQPFATFKNLWFDHPVAAYRLAGFTLAMIYRTDIIRKTRNG